MNILITGAARGLGYALALEFAARNCTVFGTVRNQEDVHRLTEEFGDTHRFYVADVTDASQMQDVAKSILAESNLDVVIANAGVINAPQPLWKISANVWRDAVDVNVMGMVNSIQAFLPNMIANDKGLFIGMSSSWGRSADAGLAPYCASKFAVEGLFESLALDLVKEKSSVAAIALDPGGGINTDMLATCLPDEHDDYSNPNDWAKLAVNYILGDLWNNKKSGSITVTK